MARHTSKRKAEVAAHYGDKPKDSPRFVVTSLKTTPRHVYKAVYCARGDAENRLKELELDLGLEIDRTSCTRFLANQLPLLTRAAAAKGDDPHQKLEAVQGSARQVMGFRGKR